MSECWRKSRLLAGRRLGPKQRRYGICPETSPTQYDWERYLAGPGYTGGCLAQRVWRGDQQDLLRFWSARRTATDNPVPSSNWQEIGQSADQDWQPILGALRHYKPGRAIPPWSAPIEIWSLSLDGPKFKMSDIEWADWFWIMSPWQNAIYDLLQQICHLQ
eukprot:16372182-Heterocapsa_arctica.AAC.1